MIDSTRIGCFATALKDRPTGVPVQPNPSLPLRPLPGIPTRTLLAKSPIKSTPKDVRDGESTPERQEDEVRSQRTSSSSESKESRCSEEAGSLSGDRCTLKLHFYDTKRSCSELADKRAKEHESHRRKRSKDRDRRSSLEVPKSVRHEHGKKRRWSSGKDASESDVGRGSVIFVRDPSKRCETTREENTSEKPVVKKSRWSDEIVTDSKTKREESELVSLAKDIPKCPRAIPIILARRYNKSYSVEKLPTIDESNDLPSMPTLDDVTIERVTQERRGEANELKIVDVRSCTESATPDCPATMIQDSREEVSTVTSSARAEVPSVVSSTERIATTSREHRKRSAPEEARSVELNEQIVKVERNRESEEQKDTVVAEKRDANMLVVNEEPRENHSRSDRADGISKPSGVLERSESKMKVNAASVVARRFRLTTELTTLLAEERELNDHLLRASDASQLRRLQQRLNCARKRIDNTKKQRDILTSLMKENATHQEKESAPCEKPKPLRIQVRKDLGQTMDTSDVTRPGSGEVRFAVSNCEPVAPLIGHTVPNNLTSPSIEGAVSIAPKLLMGSAITQPMDGSTGSPIEQTTLDKHESSSCSDQFVHISYRIPVLTSENSQVPEQTSIDKSYSIRVRAPVVATDTTNPTGFASTMIPITVNDCTANNPSPLAAEVKIGSVGVVLDDAKQPVNDSACGIFSRNNGGANINLSSPLQGQSVVPQPHYGQMTAQEFPTMVETSRVQQMTRIPGYNAVAKSPAYNAVVNTPPAFNSQSHLKEALTTQTRSTARALRTIDATSASQQATGQPSSYHLLNLQMMSEQFPTLANWAAHVMNPNLEANNSQTPPTTGGNVSRYAYPVPDAYNQTSDGACFNATANEIWESEMRRQNQQHAMQGYHNQVAFAQQIVGDHMTIPYVVAPGYSAPVSHTVHHKPGQEMWSQNSHHQNNSAPRNSHPGHRMKHPSQQPARVVQSKTFQPPAYSSIPASHPNQNKSSNSNSLNGPGFRPPPSYSYPSPVYGVTQTGGYVIIHNNLGPNDPNSPNYASAHARPQASDKAPKSSRKSAKKQAQYQIDVNRNGGYPIDVRQFNCGIMPNGATPHMNGSILPNAGHTINTVTVSNGASDIAKNRTTGQGPRDHPQVRLLGEREYFSHHNTQQYGQYNMLQNGVYCTACSCVSAIFSCVGCEMVFYCSEFCQKSHWSTHMVECSRKMPKLKRVF